MANIFVCKQCGNRFNEPERDGYMFSNCPKCLGNMTAKQPTSVPYFYMRGSYIDHRKVDSGIPFGEVPGDHIYTDSQGRKPGDTDYIGPLP